MSTADLLAKIDAVLIHETPQRHSYFQLKYFNIGKEPTIQSKMWQCIKELKVRRDSLDAIALEIEDSKDKLQLLDISIKKIEIDKIQLESTICPKYGSLSYDEFCIKIKQIHRQKKALDKSISDLQERKKWIEEESLFFLETFQNLLQIEPLKHFDDIDSQTKYWSERLSQKLNLKMLTHNQLDTELVETIISLPDDMPIKQQTLATLKTRHASMIHQLKETMNRIENQEQK